MRGSESFHKVVFEEPGARRNEPEFLLAHGFWLLATSFKFPAMISALTGILKRVDEDRVHFQAGPIMYELLVPAADLAELQASLGEELTLHTIFYLAGDVSRGGAEPTLIGFL